MNYPVDIESFRKNFPDGFAVPPLLLEFADRIRSTTAGSLGYFRLESERFNDFWIENGSDLHAFFAFFMRDPTGGQIGYWLYDGPTTASPLIGSEGETEALGESLEDFLKHLVSGDTGAHDLDSRGTNHPASAELTKWLESSAGETLCSTHSNHPDLSQWINEWGRTQRDSMRIESEYLQIADKLRRFVKPNAEPWERASFDVLLVGTQFRMWHRSFGPKLMLQADISELESHFRAVREKRARKFPDRGLWFSAWVNVGAQGEASLSCNFMDEPKFVDERPVVSIRDYQRDLSDFPRSKHWMPEWLQARLSLQRES
jgi:hypothetical protein